MKEQLAEFSAGALEDFLKLCIPNLNSSMHKGDMGRLAIFGGSASYVGAPYYVARAAMAVGVDLTYIYAEDEDARLPLKVMLPETIVPPLSEDLKSVDLSKIDAFCIGSGGGSRAQLLRIMDNELSDKPIVVDAHAIGFYLDTSGPNTRKPVTILTPNPNEMRLYLDQKPFGDNVFIFRKGPQDEIIGKQKRFDVKKTSLDGQQECLKRCGGQGDIVAGLLAGLLAVAHAQMRQNRSLRLTSDVAYVMCIFASRVVRKAAAAAYVKKERGMIASDILAELTDAIQQEIKCCRRTHEIVRRDTFLRRGHGEQESNRESAEPRREMD